MSGISSRFAKKKKKDEEANILKNKMIKKNTRKVIFGKKKRNPITSACAIPESWALESFFQLLKGTRNQSR